MIGTILRLLWFPIAVLLELAEGFREMFDEVLEDRPVPCLRRKKR